MALISSGQFHTLHHSITGHEFPVPEPGNSGLISRYKFSVIILETVNS